MDREMLRKAAIDAVEAQTGVPQFVTIADGVPGGKPFSTTLPASLPIAVVVDALIDAGMIGEKSPVDVLIAEAERARVAFHLEDDLSEDGVYVSIGDDEGYFSDVMHGARVVLAKRAAKAAWAASRERARARAEKRRLRSMLRGGGDS